MIAAFLPLAAIAGLGALLRHFTPGREQTRQAINKLVLHVLLPALVFRPVRARRLDARFLQVPAVAAAGVGGGLRRLPTEDHVDHVLSTARRQPGILVDVHSGPSRTS